ncbi:MAG: hypothetical protein ABI082_11540 [Dokdonella sp.]
MKRRTCSHLILLAVVALLGAAVYAEVQRERTFGIDPLTQIDPTAVQSVAVTCSGCKPRRFEKVGGHWQMREPFAQAADDVAVERLAAIARAPVRLRHARGELVADKLGLDPAYATLTLDGTLLKFGTTDAINGDRYVEVDGVIALVPDRFSARIFETPESELASPSKAVAK